MHVEEGNFYASRGPTTVPLTLISCNTVFSKSQNAHKAGTLCTLLLKKGFVPPVPRKNKKQKNTVASYMKFSRTRNDFGLCLKDYTNSGSKPEKKYIGLIKPSQIQNSGCRLIFKV